MAIGRSLEIGEGYAPNIFFCIEQKPDEIITPQIMKEAPGEKLLKEKTDKKIFTPIVNPFRLTSDDLMEIADYNIRLLKSSGNFINFHWLIKYHIDQSINWNG